MDMCQCASYHGEKSGASRPSRLPHRPRWDTVPSLTEDAHRIGWNVLPNMADSALPHHHRIHGLTRIPRHHRPTNGEQLLRVFRPTFLRKPANPGRFFLLTGARQGIYPTLIIVLVSLNLAQDRDTQGPVDTGLKFSSSTVNGPTRTVSFSLAHAPSSSAAIVNKGDVESGGIELAAEARSGRVCVTKIPDFESNPDVKGIFVHQVTDVS